MDKKTPLYDCHVASGGDIVPFAGYLLPVQYKSGIITEHNAVRNRAGLFDVSHMGELMLCGSDALANVNNIVTNDCTAMQIGQVKYSPMCNESGGIVDDVLVYKMSEHEYMIVVNASNREKDAAWVSSRLFSGVQFSDISDSVAQIALQGPQSQAILSKLCSAMLIPQKYYTFSKNVDVCGVNCTLSKTGYTGESGFELYCTSGSAVQLWNSLLECGKEYGLIPCGLGSRDTLRLEAAMPLYGHELGDDITPYEAGLANFVKLDKPDFVGKNALVDKQIPSKKRVGLKMTSRGIARENCGIFLDSVKIGTTTSGTHTPHLGYAIAMAYVDAAHSQVGTSVQIDVRGRLLDAQIVALPFYTKSK